MTSASARLRQTNYYCFVKNWIWFIHCHRLHATSYTRIKTRWGRTRFCRKCNSLCICNKVSVIQKGGKNSSVRRKSKMPSRFYNRFSSRKGKIAYEFVANADAANASEKQFWVDACASVAKSYENVVLTRAKDVDDKNVLIQFLPIAIISVSIKAIAVTANRFQNWSKLSKCK